MRPGILFEFGRQRCGELNVVPVHGADAAFRAAGHGSRLLKAAEEEAVRLGCRSDHLGTFGFQARPFPEKQGHHVFGELPGDPAGYTRYFPCKQLGSTPAA